MNTSAEITLRFGDSAPEGYLFALKGKQIEELQKKCGSNGEEAPIGTIGRRIMSGDWSFQDIFHTLRLALIGGGMPPTSADEVVRNYILPLAAEDDPSSPVAVAQGVMQAIFFGMDSLEPGTDDEGKEKAGS